MANEYVPFGVSMRDKQKPMRKKSKFMPLQKGGYCKKKLNGGENRAL